VPANSDREGEEAMTIADTRTRWLALLILCLGDLTIVLDVTIVGVALPSIREDLDFSEESFACVVNAYLITFGGFLLLGGRLGDLFGHRRLFLVGIACFTVASAVCVLGASWTCSTARAVQGLGAAIVSAVALSLIMTLFTEPAERAKAMGIFGFVASGGGSIGVLLGGVLTDALNCTVSGGSCSASHMNWRQTSSSLPNDALRGCSLVHSFSLRKQPVPRTQIWAQNGGLYTTTVCSSPRGGGCQESRPISMRAWRVTETCSSSTVAIRRPRPVATTRP
jgi:MFS family permease